MVTMIKAGISPAEADTVDRQVREVVERILDDVRQRGEAAIREISQRLDNWSPPSFRLSRDEIEELIDRLPAQVVADIEFAQAQVRHFAQQQRNALHDIEVETLPGVKLGHKNIPVSSAGCYVPGGRYAMVASAHMSIVTAKVAGVKRIIACTPPMNGASPAATVAAMHLGGADDIYILGGVQAVAAMALGTETIAPVDMLVGPGNAYVAEAKLSSPPPYYNVDSYLETLRRLRELRPEWLLTAHYPVIHGAEVDMFFAESLAFVDRVDAVVLEIVRATRRPTMLGEVVAAIDARLGPFALAIQWIGPALAHLARHVTTGRLALHSGGTARAWSPFKP
jgi:hypothetical protein